MRNFKVLVFLGFILSCEFCDGQSWLWAEQGAPGPTTFGQGWCTENHTVTVDLSGNAYVVGGLHDTLTFGSFTLSTGNSYSDIFLVKYDINGNVLWAKQSKTLASFPPLGFNYQVAIDSLDNIFVSGPFNGTITFGTDTLVSDTLDFFLAKYNTNGNVMWARQGQLHSYHSSANFSYMAVDKYGNCYLAGDFTDTISIGSHTLITSPSTYGANVFTVKYDSSGNVLWAKQAQVPSWESGGEPTSVATDESGNSYVAGRFKDTISFGAFTFSSIGIDGDLFVVKYDANGNVIWAKQGANAGSNLYLFDYIYSSTVDASGNIYISGGFSDSLTFDSVTLSNASYTTFLIKFNTSGNVLWAEQSELLDNNMWAGWSVSCPASLDDGGYLVMATQLTFSNPPFKVEFGSDTFSLNTDFTSAVVLLHFDTNGRTACGSIITNGWGANGFSVGVDPLDQYVYLYGSYDGDSIIIGSDTLHARFADMPFTARWQPCVDTNITTSTPPISNTPSLSLFPNPNTGAFTIAFVGTQKFEPATVEIYNVMGQKVFKDILRSAQDDNLIDMGNQPNGIYLYRVIDESGALVGEGKFVIAK